MSDPTSQTPAQPAEGAVPHGAVKIRGGPHKVLGIQKSAQDAQAERERFAAEQGENDAGTAEGSEAQKQGEEVHPAVSHLRGGPNKFQGIKESHARAEEERKTTVQDETDCAKDGEEPKEGGQPHPAIAKLRGGPNKIQGIKESVARAKEERKQSALEEGGDC